MAENRHTMKFDAGIEPARKAFLKQDDKSGFEAFESFFEDFLFQAASATAKIHSFNSRQAVASDQRLAAIEVTRGTNHIRPVRSGKLMVTHQI